MAAQLSQAIPGPNHPLVDRYRNPTPVWYPWFVKIVDFINGIANGELIVDGAITSRTIATGAITADAIAANAITVDKIDATNLAVLDGTFGTLKTNETTTRVQITDADNELRCYVNGSLIASMGANVVSNAAFLLVAAPVASNGAWYPAQFLNYSTTGGDLGTGGGSLACASVGGYAAQFTTSATGAAAAINAANTGTGGGAGQIGRSAALGGWSFYDVDGSGYGPFTGAHDGVLRKAEMPEPGDIMCDGDVIGRQLSDVMTIVARCTSANQPALGVFVRRYAISDAVTPPSMRSANLQGFAAGHDMAVINSLGEGCINVCGQNGNIAKGDLIVTSTVPGKGMRQADDIVRSYTVARAREAVTFASPTATAQIACIYLSG